MLVVYVFLNNIAISSKKKYANLIGLVMFRMLSSGRAGGNVLMTSRHSPGQGHIPTRSMSNYYCHLSFHFDKHYYTFTCSQMFIGLFSYMFLSGVNVEFCK